MDLSRFHDAQDGSIETALAELKAGRKRTHWMWWVFPQLASLGQSSRAKLYGIADLSEAKAYLADPLLGRRLHAAFQAILQHSNTPADVIMGEVDALKLRSSATLFIAASDTGDLKDDLKATLETFYGGEPCGRTIAALGFTELS